MDQNVWNAALTVMKELEGALAPVELEVHRLDPEKTGDIPTVEVSRPGGQNRIVCNIMPASMGGLETVFVQLYMTLTAPAPADRLEELERFVQGANQRFMLGSLLTFQGGLCMRYSLALDPAVPMEPAHIQTAFAVFFRQAVVYAGLGRAVCGGEMTAEAALAHRA